LQNPLTFSPNGDILKSPNGDRKEVNAMNTNRLRGEIVSRFRTQNAFAAYLGWTPNKVSKLLTGKYKPDTDDVATITNALNMDERTFCDIFLPKESPNGDN
jgi:hypothetical protein